MAINLRFLPPIPAGHCLFASDLEVSGIQHHKADALSFAHGKEHSLEFVPEPDNPHDRNAIAIWGSYTGWLLRHRVHVGYVPADVAKALGERNLIASTLARLKNIWVSDEDFVIV